MEETLTIAEASETIEFWFKRMLREWETDAEQELLKRDYLLLMAFLKEVRKT